MAATPPAASAAAVAAVAAAQQRLRAAVDRLAGGRASTPAPPGPSDAANGAPSRAAACRLVVEVVTSKDVTYADKPELRRAQSFH
jgi:hypothetical protein